MMITYKELSSLTADLGFSAKTLYGVSNHIAKHYHKAEILKANGETRTLTVPDDLLKSIQRKIAETLLSYEEISPYATAYCYGGSTLKNAGPHLGQPVVLKLDIKGFFDHIIYPLVKKKVFPESRYSEPNRILLTLLCVYRDALPQGAPTSPVISNIIMREFDDTVGTWCGEKGIRYTRYCDDMTFSGAFAPGEVISFVRQELSGMGFFLNEKKTTVARRGQKQIVTGIVVNEKPNTTVLYRKKLRQEVYFCKKYGVASHISRSNFSGTETDYLRKLLGRINYVLAVDKSNREMQENRIWAAEELKKAERTSPQPNQRKKKPWNAERPPAPKKPHPELLPEPECGKIIKGREIVVGDYLRISPITGSCAWDMEEAERIYIEAESATSFLLYFLEEYFDPIATAPFRTDTDAEEFGWNWENNIYSRSAMEMMLEEIQLVSLLLEEEYDHPALDELKDCFTEEAFLSEGEFYDFFLDSDEFFEKKKEVAIAFYRDFCGTMKNLMRKHPDCRQFAAVVV